MFALPFFAVFFGALAAELLWWREFVFGSVFTFFFVGLSVAVISIFLQHRNQKALLGTAVLELSADAIYPGDTLEVCLRVNAPKKLRGLRAGFYLTCARTKAAGPLTFTIGEAQTSLLQNLASVPAGEAALRGFLMAPEAAQHSLDISTEQIFWSLSVALKMGVTTWLLEQPVPLRVLPVAKPMASAQN